MNADPPRPRKSVLTRGQRRLLGVLLVVAGGVLANSVYLTVTTPPEAAVAAPPGLYEASAWGRAGIADIAGPALSSAEREIPGLYQWMLLAHFFGGGAATGLALGFVVWHLRNALARRNRRAVSYGIALVAGSLLLSISGLFILTEAASVQNRWIFSAHQVLAVLVPLLYLGHRLVSIVPPTRRALAVGLTSIGLLIAALLATHGLVAASRAQPAGVPAQSARPAGPAATGAVHDPFIPFVPNNLGSPGSKFFPSASTTTTGDFIQRLTLTQDDLAPDDVMRSDLEKYGFLLNGSMGSATCNRCHPAVVEQWSRSAHRFSSFNNPFYKAAVENLRTEPEGKVRSQWCGGCHDPNLMFAGKMTGEIDPMTPEAQAGLTCLACHAIDAIHGKAGNGNYNLVDNAPDPYLFATTKDGLGRGLHDMLVKSKPTVHKRQMLKPFFRQSESRALAGALGHRDRPERAGGQFDWGPDEDAPTIVEVQARPEPGRLGRIRAGRGHQQIQVRVAVRVEERGPEIIGRRVEAECGLLHDFVGVGTESQDTRRLAWSPAEHDLRRGVPIEIAEGDP